jgi:hypothetical protein
LTDAAYAKLLDKLADAKFAQLPDSLRQNILEFYRDPKAINATKRKPDEWSKTLRNIEQLKLVAAETPAASIAEPLP